MCVCVCVIEKLQQCCDLSRSLAVLPEGFRREQRVNAFKTVTVKLILYAYTGSASESGDLATAVFYLRRERGRGMMLPGGVAVNSVQFETESWTGSQRAFAVK